ACMRSAETSGVEAKGFGWPISRRLGRMTFIRRATRWVAATLDGLSPVSVAVAATAIAAASISVAADIALTALDAHDRQQRIMHVATAVPVANWNYSGTTMTTLAGPA